MAKRIGIIAIAKSMAQVLRLVNITRSSDFISERLSDLANNFKPLSRQIYEVLLEAWVFQSNL